MAPVTDRNTPAGTCSQVGEGKPMNTGNAAAGDDNRRPDPSRSDEPEPPDPWRFVELGLQIAGLYFAYKHQGAATFTVTALLETIRSMRR
jgi:hypothetical protein